MRKSHRSPVFVSRVSVQVTEPSGRPYRADADRGIFVYLTPPPPKTTTLPRRRRKRDRAAGNAFDGHGSGNGAPPQGPAVPIDAEKAGDQALVDRCRAGDDDAWAEIHAKCHAHLVKQIRYTLGDRARDENLVEEIAARVWFGLVADDGYLLERFQPEKGNGLGKYLAAIARFEVLRHQRGEYRRRRREQQTQATRHSTAMDHRRDADMALDVQDFVPQLTRREREFFHHVLLGNDGETLGISAPNAWQLRHRIRRKLMAFLDLE